MFQAQKRLSNKSPEVNDTALEQADTEATQKDVTSDKDRTKVLARNGRKIARNNNEPQQDTKKDLPLIASLEPLPNDISENDAHQKEAPTTVNDADQAMPTSDGNLLKENSSEAELEHSTSSLIAKEIEISDNNNSNEAGENLEPGDSDVPSKISSERSESLNADPPFVAENSSNNMDNQVEHPDSGKILQEQTTDKSPLKVQDQPRTKVQEQLDEAQGLLKTASSTGQSKEARLARVSLMTVVC